MKGLNEVWLPYRMGQLERALEKSGGPYFCGARMTVCDLEFYVARLHGRGTRSIVNIDTRVLPGKITWPKKRVFFNFSLLLSMLHNWGVFLVRDGPG